MERTPTSQTNRTCNNLSLCDRLPPVPPPPVPRSETPARPSPVNAPLQPSHPTRPTPLACGTKPSLRTPNFNPPHPPVRPGRAPRPRPTGRINGPQRAKQPLSGPFRLFVTHLGPWNPCYGSLSAPTGLSTTHQRPSNDPLPRTSRLTASPNNPNGPPSTIQRKPIIPLRIQPMLPHHQNLSHRRR